MFGLVHEFPLTVRREHHHRVGQVLFKQDLGRGQSIQKGHLDIHEHQVGPALLAGLHGVEAVCGLSHHLISLFAQQFLQIHPGDGFVIRDNNPNPVLAHTLFLLVLTASVRPLQVAQEL